MTLLERTQGATAERHCPTCTCTQHENDDNPNDENSPIYGFDIFWGLYPMRNGRRVGKTVTKNKWRKLTLTEKRRVIRAVRNYKSAMGDNSPYVKDPARFLASDYWKDWYETTDAQSAPRTPPRPAWVPSNAIYDATRGQWVA